MCDISRVWYFRKLVNASLFHDIGLPLDKIGEAFKVKPLTAKKYLDKFVELKESEDSEIQYKLYVALLTPEKNYDPDTFDQIMDYIYKLKIYEKDWFFRI